MDTDLSTEGVGDAQPVSEADEAVLVACKQLDAGVLGRQPRFNVIKKNEDMYNGFNPPALKGRSNIPFDTIVMRGYMDTLMSLVDERTSIKYERSREQDKRAADKITAVFDCEMSPQRGAWDYKIMDAKKLAAMSGRGFLKLFMTSSPKFETDLEVCDHYDMVTEPLGGGYLDRHLYKFQMNIFRSREDLMTGVKQSFYDKAQVRKLIMRQTTPDVFKTNLDIYKNKNNRFLAFGIDIEANAYVGQRLYRLVEGVINYKGKWMYILFNYETKLWIRYEPLEDVFSWAKDYPGRGPWVSFATHRDAFIFWNQAPADDVRPIAYTMKKMVNLTVDNLEKRNWDMKIYDPKKITDPTQLLYRQDAIVKATLKTGERLDSAIMQLQTPDTTQVSVNMVTFLDNFLGLKTGITSGAQGDSAEQTVGVSYLNMQNVSKRIKLENKMFRQALLDLGIMFDYGLYDHLREPYAIKLIGLKGVDWEETVTREDVSREFQTMVISGDEKDEKDVIAAQKKEAMFARIQSDPILAAQVNKSWYARENLKDGGIPEEQIKVALDVNNDGDEEVLSVAAQRIEDIREGKSPDLYYGATSGFMQKILNFAREHKDGLKDSVYMKLLKYAQDHKEIATQNMARLAISLIAQKGISAINAAGGAKPPVPGANMLPPPGGAPAPTPGGPTPPQPVPAPSAPGTAAPGVPAAPAAPVAA